MWVYTPAAFLSSIFTEKYSGKPLHVSWPSPTHPHATTIPFCGYLKSWKRPQAYHFLHLNQANTFHRKIVSLIMEVSHEKIHCFNRKRAMYYSGIERSKINGHFHNLVTESDVEEGAPNIATVDSDADDDLDIEI